MILNIMITMHLLKRNIFFVILSFLISILSSAQTKTTINTAPIKSNINSKLITYSSDKDFKWVEWEKAPKEIIEATKYAIISSIDGNITVYNKIQDYIKNGCNYVQISLIDLNNNGIYGFAIQEQGGMYC